MRYVQRIVLLGLCVTVWAGSPVLAADSDVLQNPAAKFIQDLGDRGVKILSDQNLSQEQRMQDYRQILRDSFDLPTIGRFVLGRAWQAATPEQRQDYLKLFEALVVKIYGNRLLSYKGESLQVTAVRQENDRDSVVSSEILHLRADAPPTHVDWRVRRQGGRYAVIDVVVEGVSQSISQREEYATIINRDGGKIDGLLTELRARLKEPAPSSE